MFRKLVVLSALSLVLLVGTIPQPAIARGGGEHHSNNISIYPPWSGDTFYVNAQENVNFYLAWAVCTNAPGDPPGNVPELEAYKNAVYWDTFRLWNVRTRETIISKHMEKVGDPWSDYIERPENADGCISPEMRYFVSYWKLSIRLEPGTYQFTALAYLRGNVTDNFDSDGDGEADYYRGYYMTRNPGESFKLKIIAK